MALIHRKLQHLQHPLFFLFWLNRLTTFVAEPGSDKVNQTRNYNGDYSILNPTPFKPHREFGFGIGLLDGRFDDPRLSPRPSRGGHRGVWVFGALGSNLGFGLGIYMVTGSSTNFQQVSGNFCRSGNSVDPSTL